MKKILVIEDKEIYVRLYGDLVRLPGIEIVSVTTLSAARLAFSENKEQIVAIVMDECLEGDGQTFDTEELTEEIKQSGFSGPIIASSSSPDINNLLMAAGCTHSVSNGKMDVPQMLKRLLS